MFDLYHSQLCRTRHDCWTDWGNLITHLLTYQGIRWSWVTDYFSYLARVDAGFWHPKARESGLLHSCHYSSVKKTAWKIQWPAIWVWTKPVPTNSSKFYLNQSQQIHLNFTKAQSFSFNLKFLCANFSPKVWAFSESEWFSPNVGSWWCPYQYRTSHCWDKTILWSSYLHNGISI